MQILKLTSFPIEQVQNLQALELDLAAWFVARDYPVRLLAYSQAFQMQPAIAHIQHAQSGMERIQQAVTPLLHAIDAFLVGDVRADPADALREIPPHILALLLETFALSPMIQQLLVGDGSVGADDARTRWAMLADAFDLILWRLPWTKEAIRFYQALEQRHLRAATYLMITWETTRCLGAVAAHHPAAYLPPPGRAPGLSAERAAMCLHRADAATRPPGVWPTILRAAALLRHAG